MRRRLARTAIGFLLGAIAAIAASQVCAQPAAPPSRSTWPNITDSATDGPHRFVTRHEGTFNGRPVRYRATVAETILADAKGRPATRVFNTSFVADPPADPASRPVIFVFNGGPGGAANTLLLGALGPKRMAAFSVAAQADPKTPLEDNPDTVLDVADLVFVDPPETGWGRPLPDADPKTFRGIDADAFAVGQFILHWLRANGRMASPKYLAGESYGGHRIVALLRDLPRATPKVELQGVILISQALTYNGPGGSGAIRHLPDPLRGIGRLEDAAAIAWYHGKVENRRQTLAQAVTRARAYLEGPYVHAMLRGNRLDPAARREVAAHLSELTGLSPDYFITHDLRLGDLRLDLLKDRGLMLDQFDGRETAPWSQASPRDRDWDAVMLGLTEAMIRYAQSDLGVRGLERYRSVVPDPYGFEDTWAYLPAGADGLDLILSQQLKAQPRVRVLSPLGLFDTTSSLNGAEAMLAQLDVPAERITVTYNPGGHMVYASPEGRVAFDGAIRAFVSGQPIRSRAFPRVKPAG